MYSEKITIKLISQLGELYNLYNDMKDDDKSGAMLASIRKLEELIKEITLGE